MLTAYIELVYGLAYIASWATGCTIMIPAADLVVCGKLL